MRPNEKLVSLQDKIDGDILFTPEDTSRYLTDWRGIWTGRAIGVARPRSKEDVSTLVRWCHESRTPIVPQGGNTGLSGGATPDNSAEAMVISLERLKAVRSFDAQANILEVEAGLTLAGVQEEAERNGQLFPLSLAAEGTCQVGGVLATNAGGTHVFRYGSARDLCIGLEVVLPNGDIWQGTKALFKDNTGYALRHLFVGSEGTLGVITAAALKLFPKPKGSIAIFLGAETLKDICDLYASAREEFGPELTACELIANPCLQAVISHVDAARAPLQEDAPYFALLEVSSWESEERARERAMTWLEAVFEKGLILDATVSESLSQFSALWGLREYISESQSANRPVIKHDISIPLSKISEFTLQCTRALADAFPQVAVEPFGHLGDGNLHFNVVPVDGANHDEFKTLQAAVNLLVHDMVDAAGGSISAEHGLGVLRRDEAARYKSEQELDLLRSIKRSIDPHSLMNPGKVLQIEEK